MQTTTPETRPRVEIITPNKNNSVAEFFSSPNTPETDAVTMQPVDGLTRAYTFHGTEPYKYSTKELVPAEFARKLERERDEAREELSNLRLNLGEDAEGYTLLHAVAALQNERDDLYYKLQDAKQSLEVALQDLSSTKKET